MSRPLPDGPVKPSAVCVPALTRMRRVPCGTALKGKMARLWLKTTVSDGGRAITKDTRGWGGSPGSVSLNTLVTIKRRSAVQGISGVNPKRSGTLRNAASALAVNVVFTQLGGALAQRVASSSTLAARKNVRAPTGACRTPEFTLDAPLPGTRQYFRIAGANSPARRRHLDTLGVRLVPASVT